MTSHSLTPIALYAAPLGSLAHLGFKAFMPHPYLQHWVQCYWIAQTNLSITGFSENLYPDGGTGLIIDFQLDDTPTIYLNATQSLTQMHFDGRIDRMGIRFQPGGIYQLLDIEVPAIIGNELNTDHLGIAAITDLQQRLQVAESLSQRLQTLETWLLQQAFKRGAQTGLIQQLLPRLQLTNESIDKLSSQSTLSRRQLERKFHDEVGLSPHQLKQLHRVRHARRMITLTPETPLVDIAQQVGFYDQAHFIRHFQKITRQTPGQYRDKKMSQKYNPQ